MFNPKHSTKLAEKVARLANIYEEFIIDDKIEVAAEYCQTKEHFSLPPNEQYKSLKRGDKWGGDFVYGWFKLSIRDEQLGDEVYLCCESNAIETLVFMDNVPYGMFDVAEGTPDAIFRKHKYLRLPKDYYVHKFACEGYCGHTFVGTMPYEGAKTFGQTVKRDECVYKGYFLVKFNEDVKLFVKNMNRLNSIYRSSNGFQKADAVRAYHKLFALIELMPSDGYDISNVKNANELFIEIFASDSNNKPKLPHIGLVGHSHLDTAWLWTVDETKRKSARTAANAVRLLEQYEDYRFVMSSVLYLDWLKQYYPDLLERIKVLAAKDKFEANGAVWVECDCNLVGGEQMCRQFLRGQKWLVENGFPPADTFWLPDTFGYSAALPQIMAGSGVKYFLTTKLRWNDTNSFPYETFYWQGVDGSKIFSHFNTIHCPADIESVGKRADDIVNKELSQRALIAYGYGDGGGGPDEEMVIEAIATTQQSEAVSCAHTTVSDFMRELESDDFNYPTYKGELYLELHRGTLTANHRLKQLNRQLEITLSKAEYITAFCGNEHSDIGCVNAAYDTLLLNQFHDILPGTCINEVNTLAIEQNSWALVEMTQHIARKVQQLGVIANDSYSLSNFSPFDYDGVTHIDGNILTGELAQNYNDIDGKAKKAIEVSIPARSARSYMKSDDKSQKSAFTFNNGVLTSPHYVVRFDNGGKICSLFDKDAQRETVKGSFNRIAIGENVPYNWDNWDIDSDYVLKLNDTSIDGKPTVIMDGAIEFRLRQTISLSDSSQLIQDIVFYASSRRIDFENKLIWNDKHKVVKVFFDTNIITDTIKSEMQFCHIDRSTNENTSVEQAQFEFCNHKWSDISENRYGIAFLNDCKYGVSCRDGSFSLTLLTSGTHPDTTADKGTHYFTYSVLPHLDGFSADSVVKQAYMLGYGIEAHDNIRADLSAMARVDKNNVIIETIKPSYDSKDIVLRIYECERNRTNCVLSFNKGYDIFSSNMLENDQVLIASDANSVSLQLAPFEIITLILHAKNSL